MAGKIKRITAFFMTVLLFFGAFSGTAFAAAPEKPEIASEGATLYNATAGTFLFDKNADTAYYPASITKLMTALLVIEKCSLDDTVTFSSSATSNMESGAVTLDITAGDKISVRDCLYALLLKSANEVANGLAEHVSGSVPAFADLMNEKAKALGCTGTHFVNPNGLTSSAHYTTPHDMALIAKACFENDAFRKIDSTTSYSFPATIKHPNGTLLVMGHKMIDAGNSQHYDGILGGKTGYTSAAGNTLVTCAERNGVRLIAVVMKSHSTHYEDTKALLDYGFALTGAGSTGGTQTVTALSSSAESTSAVPALGSGSTGGPGSTAASTAPEAESAAAGTSAAVTSGGPGSSTKAAGWCQDDGGWCYTKENGKKAASERLTIDGYEYWFDADGTMATGWRKDASGKWYYMRPSFGGMKKSVWLLYNGQWYYLGADGAMLENTTTPDGYQVDAQGVCVNE